MPVTPVRARLPNPGSPPPFGSVPPWPGTFSVQSGAISRASRFADAYCERTLLQSHWSSSQTIIAFEVQTPCPSSVCAIRIVTESSGAITIHALISGAVGSSYHAAPCGGVTFSAARAARGGSQKPSTNAPADAEARNSRRLCVIASPRFHELGRAMDRLAHAVVAAAAARVRDARVDVGVGRLRDLREQRERVHDHPGLAVAALRRVELLPRELDRVIAVARHALDRLDRLADREGGGEAARADRLTVDVHRARAALRDPAAELRAREPEVVADHPEQRRLRVRVDSVRCAVDRELERHDSPSGVDGGALWRHAGV